jgi:hypothetical protein
MSKACTLLTVILSALVLVACEKETSDAPPPPKTAQDAPLSDALLQQRAEMAITMVEANLGNLQDGGGYQEWTPEKAATQLVQLMTSAQAPEPGYPQTHNAQFTYVKDAVTGPWQVVIEADDAQSSIIVSAYGTDTATPLLSKTITVSRY